METEQDAAQKKQKKKEFYWKQKYLISAQDFIEDEDNKLVRIRETEPKKEEKKMTETQTEWPIDTHEENVRILKAR